MADWTDPPLAGGNLPECIRGSLAKSGVTLKVGRFVTADEQTTVDFTVAGKSASGVVTNLRSDGYVSYAYGGVVAVEAGEAIARKTDGNPTPIYAITVSGEKGYAGSTKPEGATHILGEMDDASPAAAAKGDIVYVKLHEGPIPVGLDGADGADGAAGTLVTFGTAAASGGANGDVYIKTDTGGVYKKVGGSWVLQVTLTVAGG